MKEYLIDGNNLIGKIPKLKLLQKNEKSEARAGIVRYLENYFTGNRGKVTLYLDGFRGEGVRSARIMIKYSDARPADEIIKRDISESRNPRNLVVISSDNEVTGFAKVCSCEVLLSEEFYRRVEGSKINSKNLKNDENIKINELNNYKNEFEKLFGEKK